MVLTDPNVMQNEYLSHFLAINTIALTLAPDVTKCKGRNHGGLCTNCDLCWNGLIFHKEFAYLIGDGKIRLQFEAAYEMQYIYLKLVEQGNKSGTLTTEGHWNKQWVHRAQDFKL